MEDQTTYLRKSTRSNVANARSESVVRKAFAAGAEIEILKKSTAGSNKKTETGNLAKLENETETFKGSFILSPH